MSACVLDASVAAKWFLPAAGEPLARESIHLLERYTKGEIRFVVPDLFWAEFSNILWRAVRQGRCTQKTALAAIASLTSRNFPTVPSQKLIEDALRMAVAFDRTVYDCLYVTLAVMSNAPLVTADERLAAALASHFPVKLLGAV